MIEPNYIYEGTQQNLVSLVLENSNKGPVVVNFWAEWAGPCHRLFRVLLGLTREYAGKFLLVNINTDEQKPIAKEYGINSLPLVKIFRRGQVVEEIHGYQPEPEWRRILDRHVPRESDARITAGVRMCEAGDVDGGLSLLAQAALDDPDNLRIPVVLGKLLMGQRRYAEAESLLRNLPEEARADGEISHLFAHIQFIQVARNASDKQAVRSRLQEAPKDSQARYELAALAVINNEYEAALESLLELMRRDRAFGEDAARKGMLAIFHLLGHANEIVDRYRTLMFKALH